MSWCEHLQLPDGNVAIICGRGRRPVRIVCDVCDEPVGRRGAKFNYRGVQVDLCADCQVGREAGDPEWRRLAELAISERVAVPA